MNNSLGHLSLFQGTVCFFLFFFPGGETEDEGGGGVGGFTCFPGATDGALVVTNRVSRMDDRKLTANLLPIREGGT